MSLEVIELMIKESLRDGEISLDEKEAILKQAVTFGVKKETVFLMIKEEKKRREKELREEKKESKILEERSKLGEYKKNYEEWQGGDLEGVFNDFVVQGGISLIVGLTLGVLNAYTHSKGFWAYIGMSLLGIVYGLLFFLINALITYLSKKAPMNWPKSLMIVYGFLVLLFVAYFLIP